MMVSQPCRRSFARHSPAPGMARTFEGSAQKFTSAISVPSRSRKTARFCEGGRKSSIASLTGMILKAGEKLFLSEGCGSELCDDDAGAMVGNFRRLLQG